MSSNKQSQFPKGRGPDDDETRIERRKVTRLLYVFALILLTSVVVAQLVTQRTAEQQMPYHAFEQAITDGRIQSGITSDRLLHGKMKDGSRFVVTLPPTIDSELLKRWENAGVQLDFKVKLNS